MGVVSLPSDRSARSQTSPGRVSERRTLPLLGLGRVCSRRTQKAFGTAMRLCASLFRGVAAPLGCVICLQLGDVAVFSLCAQYFFPGSLSTIPCAVTFSANMQISLSVISVANSFALWYDKFHKSGLFGDEGETE